ncbi:MAG: AfsR/SARP family transcriptional regulator [Actinomycetota bacterium]|nr:AfsR/SARP family transcriptional regulator [Actinomycetota bacterium]
MEFRVLGPLEVRCGPEVVVIGSRLERALLTALLLDANRVVSSARLVEALWGDDSPPSERNSLQTYVARLRRRLGGHGSPIITRPPGYLIVVDPRDLDSLWFEELLEQARRTDEPARVLELLDEALGLWRGPAFAEFAEVGVAGADAVRLEELRQQATEERVDALMGLGRAGAAIGQLEASTVADPLRERSHAQLMGALSRSGRQVEALRLYQRYRHRLAELALGRAAGVAERDPQAASLGLPAAGPGSPVRQPAGAGDELRGPGKRGCRARRRPRARAR